MDISQQQRLYVLQFLQKTQQQHDAEIDRLQARVQQLEANCRELSSKLDRAIGMLADKDREIDELRRKCESLAANIRKQAQTKQLSLSTLQPHPQPQPLPLPEPDPHPAPDTLQKFLHQTPAKLISKITQAIQPQKLKAKPESEEKAKGNWMCIVWGRDGFSIDRYEGVSRHFVSSFLVRKEEKVQVLMVYRAV